MPHPALRRIVCLSGWAHPPEIFCQLGELMPIEAFAPEMFSSFPGTYAEALLGFVEAQPQRPVTALGWSMGGLILLEAAAMRPDYFDRLVLVSSFARFCKGTRYPHGSDHLALRAMQQKLKREAAATVKHFMKKAYSGEPPPVASGDPGELERGLAYLQHTDVRSSLAALSMPCLLVHGSADRIVSADASRFLQSQLKHSKLVIIEGGDHGLPASQPERLAGEIKEFLGVGV